MTPTEKAEAALNARLERLQVNLRATTSESSRRFLAQSLVVCIGLGEAMTDYVRTIGEYAQGRYGEIKQTHTTLTAQHAELLKAGGELLEQLKTNPGDRAVLQEIERAQKAMESIQKTLRRGADTLQRDLAPSMGLVDKIALGVRRLAEAGQPDELKRAIGMAVACVSELYASHPGLPAKNLVDAAAWQTSAENEIDQAADFFEAYALTGYQTLRALAVMTMAVSQNPPLTAEDAIRYANETVAARLKEITLRFGAN
jgi:hypothetical protein